jgi:flagellar biosynthetic protein FliQ
MTEQMAVEICKDAVWTTLLVASPMLIAGLIVGIVVSLFQSVTQIHEMTLTFIPKILAVVLVMILALPWIIRVLLSYTTGLFSLISGVK